ncbi:hypothetical protein L3Y34_007216 [Caenorhabditis briggsae]|uniref:Receptor L-domain domain-containing protein n=1 Tax=Caenorhabditis briggsae TaxID=6238 RepID=A0AAE8ZW87_CAEBR|nr:hypothetical protein L3Y34_007216 [Caenorhabditis briggsae]
MSWFLLVLFSVFAYSYDFGSRCDKNCEFVEAVITSESIKSFPSDCHIICANLAFNENNNLTEEELKVMFYNVKTIFGSLTVQKTHFTTLKFLGNVEVIECDSNGSFTITENQFMTELGLRNLTRCACSVEVSNNENFVRLNLPTLRYFSSFFGNMSQVEMSILNVSSDFCMDIYEMRNFIANDNLYMKNVGEKFCDDKDILCSGICKPPNGTWKQMHTDCQIFNGSLTFTAGDENERVHTNQKTWLNLRENHKNLAKSVINQPNLCLPYADFNGETELHVTEIDGENCENIANKNRDISLSRFLCFSMLAVFWKFKVDN